MFYDVLPPAVWTIIAGLLGLVIGSFLNVIIHRWPRDESIVLPASHCGSCGTAIKPYDNIPLLSYVLLGGKCRACKQPIPVRYPLVEAVTGALFVAVLVVKGPGLESVCDLVFVAMLVPLIFIDAEWQLLPSAITHTGLVFALGARILVPNLVGMSSSMFGGAWLFGISASPDWFISFTGAALGATFGGGLLFVVSVAYRLIRKREGLGLGDVSMMCMVGAYLGWELTLLTILLGSLLGAVTGLVILRGEKLAEFKLPFGVFLGICAIVSLLFGERLIALYLGLF